MVNVKEILTGEQIGMLWSEISDSDMVALFLMNEDEKRKFLIDYRNIFSDKCDSLYEQYDEKLKESLVYRESDRKKYIDNCELLHDLFINMQRCREYIKVFDILLDNI